MFSDCHSGVVCKTDNTSFIFPINKNFTVSLNNCSLKSKVMHIRDQSPWNRWLCRAMLSHSVMVHSYNTWTVASQASLSMGILQTRILQWVARPSSRGSSQPRHQIQVFHTAGRFFTIWFVNSSSKSRPRKSSAPSIKYFPCPHVPSSLKFSLYRFIHLG